MIKRVITLCTSLLLITSLLTACNKPFEPEPTNSEINVTTSTTPLSPIELEGYLYPYVYNIADKSSEPVTSNVITTRDSRGILYPYSYGTVTEEVQTAYARLVTGMYNMESYIDLSDLSVTPDDILLVFQQIITEIPELYYVEHNFNYELKETYEIAGVLLKYSLTAEEVAIYDAKLEEIVQSIKSHLPSDISLYDLYIYLHDFVSLNTVYNEAYDGVNDSNVIGALIDKKGTCQAFAAGFLYLCRKFDITTCIVSGSVGLAHIWNLVPYGDDWMHVDVGMDNIDSEYADDLVKHSFFGVTSNWLVESAGHTINETIGVGQLYTLPESTNEQLNFLDMQGFILKDCEPTKTPTEIESYLTKAVANNIPFIEVKVDNHVNYLNVKDDYLSSNSNYIWTIIANVNEATADAQFDINNVGCCYEDWNNSFLLYVLFEE